LRCSNGMLAEGIDVRADGGFAIHWPATGRWFKDAPLSDWPHWLLAQALPLHSVSSWEVTLDGVPYQSGVAA
jgi:hypothetical protein